MYVCVCVCVYIHSTECTQKAATRNKLHLASERTSDIRRTEMGVSLLETEVHRSSS